MIMLAAVGEATVKTHVSLGMAKLGAGDRNQTVVLVCGSGIA